jgi:hypothetical protein
LADALAFSQIAGSKYRASYIHVPSSTASKTTSTASAALHHLRSKKSFSGTPLNDLLGFIESVRTSQEGSHRAEAVQHILTSAHPSLIGPDVKLAEVASSEAYLSTLDVGYKLKKALSLVSDKSYLLVNGRVGSHWVRPIGD